MKTGEVSKAGERSEAARTSRDALSDCNNIDGGVLSSRRHKSSPSLQGHYWSTTSLLDMASALHRRMMLEDVEEEDDDEGWGDSACDSTSDSEECDSLSGEEDNAILTDPLLATSNSMPELHNQLSRVRSSSLPRCMTIDEGLERCQQRRSSVAQPVGRNESLRRQIMQGTNRAEILRPDLTSSVELLCSNAQTTEQRAQADGGASQPAGSAGMSTQALGFNCPLWSTPEQDGNIMSRSSLGSVSQSSQSVVLRRNSRSSLSRSSSADQSRMLKANRISYVIALNTTPEKAESSNKFGTIRRIKKFLKQIGSEKSYEQTPSMSELSSRLSSSGSSASSYSGSATGDTEPRSKSASSPEEFERSSSARAASSSPDINGKSRRRKKSKSRTEFPVFHETGSLPRSRACPSAEPPEETKKRRSTLLPRIYSPMLIRRLRKVDRQQSTSVPSDLHSSSEPSCEPPVRPLLSNVRDTIPRHLAEELTLMDAHFQQQIQACELQDGAWMNKDRDIVAPNVMRMVYHFNFVARMTTREVLLPLTPSKRAKTIAFFIQVGEECLKLQNFNSLKAILAGLQCTPMFRLKRTWKELSDKKLSKFDELSDLMSENRNYFRYRESMLQALEKPPCVPFLGVFLTSIVQMDSYDKLHRRRRSSRRVSIKRNISTKGIKKERPRRVSTKRGVRHQVTKRKLSSTTSEDSTATSVKAQGQPQDISATTEQPQQPQSACEEEQQSQQHDCPLDRLEMPQEKQPEQADDLPSDAPSQAGEQTHEKQQEQTNGLPSDTRSKDIEEASGSGNEPPQPQQSPAPAEPGVTVAKAREAGLSSSAPSASSALRSSQHGSIMSEESGFGSGYNSRANSTTTVCLTEVQNGNDGERRTELPLRNGSPSEQAPSPLAATPESNTQQASMKAELSTAETIASETSTITPSVDTNEEDCTTTDQAAGSETAKETTPTASSPPSRRSSTTSRTSQTQTDGSIAKAGGTLRRLFHYPGKPAEKKRPPSTTSDSHDASYQISSTTPSPNSRWPPAGIEEEQPVDTSCRVTAHMPFEEQLKRYNMAASRYRHSSRPWVRHLIVNYPDNTEDQNYSLSCEREPSKRVSTA